MSADWADVNGGGIEPADARKQLVLRLVGEFVGFADGQARVGCDVGFGPEPVPNPADAQLAYFLDAVDDEQGFGGAVDERRVHSIHQAGADLADRGAQHGEDRDRDDQTDDGVGPAPAEATPPTPSRTARLVKPSVRACRPSATRAAEPMRRLAALIATDRDVTELTELTGVPRPAVSQHLGRLRLGGLVQARPEGRR